jgi:phage shock protein A
MSESLSSRVGRIVSGSLHALVGAIESAAPEAVLDEAIRDVDGAIDDVRSELGRELAKKHLASARLAELGTRHEELGAKLELALHEGREDLAEAAAAQQLDLEAQIPVLERHLADCGDREKELERLVGALQAKKREMREEMREFVASRAAASARSGAAQPAALAGGGAAVRAERASDAFDRMLERSTGLPSGAPRDLANDKKLAELEQIARRNRVRERVAEARVRMEST